MIAARSILTLAVVLVGLSAGFFFTYEASVTLGLAEVDDTNYVETFQALNATIRNPAFGLVFFGSVPALIAAVAMNWQTTGRSQRAMMVGALALYLTGMIITVAGNLPLNDELAGYEQVGPAEAAVARADFEADWNRLNLLRGLAIGGAFIALAAATVPVRGGTDVSMGGGRSQLDQTA